MQHPDEGTIHAWLDGELSPADAAALEAHVAGCAACAAAVAEARGLVAASTRILGALDEVEANVIPATPDAKVVPLPVSAPKRQGRPFYRHPQFGAVAAVLVLAVGTWTVLQRAPSRDMAIPMALPEPAPAAEMMDSAALGNTPARAQSVPAAPVVAAPVDQASSSASARPGQPRGSAKVAVALEAKKEQGETDERTRRDYAGNAVGARALADAAPRRVDTLRKSPPATSTLGRLAQERTDSARPSPVAAPAPLRQRMALADSAGANEARRLAGETRVQRASPALQEVVVTGAASAARQEPLAVRCYAVEQSPLALQLNVPERIALHPDAGPMVAGQAWRVVRVPTTGETSAWSWLTIDGATVQLARIEGSPPTIAQRVALSATGSATTLRATLVGC